MRTTSPAAPMPTIALRAVLVAGLLAGCTGGADEPDAGGTGPGSTPATRSSSPAPSSPGTAELPPSDPAASLTRAGRAAVESRGLAQDAPRVRVDATADPVSGLVEGVMTAELPVGTDATEAAFRYFAGLESFRAAPADTEARVDGQPAESTRTAGLLTVSLPPSHGERVAVRIPFSYTLPAAKSPSLLETLRGDLEPAQIGLLARHPEQMSLGHWFPLWVPPGMRDDADPRGYGDISNFAAADLSLTLTVPQGWTVVDGGVRIGEEDGPGTTTIRSTGMGMRDLAVAIVRDDYAHRTRTAGEVTISAWGPPSSAEHLEAVLEETAAAITVLSERLGGYPWREFDVVSTPLGGGVAGMEWPGATWIEAATFEGGVAGLGRLGSLLGPLLGALAENTRPWTIAHEVAHSWWTILVGNDSIAAPVVDEPLAQYSACLVLRTTHRDAGDICRAQIVGGYTAMKQLRTPDGAADRATDEFASSLQYAGLVYGKAAWFYVALEQEFGAERVQRALAALVRSHAFELVTADQVRGILRDELGVRAGRLWDRWMHQAHGDDDLPAPVGAGSSH